MGTIDEHIVQLKKLKSFHNGSYGASINFAIDTMRKYQKIQAIAEKCNLKLLPKEAMNTFMKEVLGVLEDGDDD